ncbi:hypothetical protein BJV82DRAFT_623432 [Fennellomyces sp. T-0311]|nr:hypothetical protein BJV82DRAFT_623432 [Fennellomyces sp. T-0311]
MLFFPIRCITLQSIEHVNLRNSGISLTFGASNDEARDLAEMYNCTFHQFPMHT